MTDTLPPRTIVDARGPLDTFHPEVLLAALPAARLKMADVEVSRSFGELLFRCAVALTPAELAAFKHQSAGAGHTHLSCSPPAPASTGQSPRWVYTLVGPEVTSALASSAVAEARRRGLSLTATRLLSSSAPTALDLHFEGVLSDPLSLNQALLSEAASAGCDAMLQPDDALRGRPRLVVFDMDSTLIQTEVINELAREHGVEPAVAAITERAMNGELDFDQSLRERLGLMRGLSTRVLDGIAARLPISAGAPKLLAVLKVLGARTAILSGGFTYFAKHVQALLGLDEIHANELEISDQQLTGRVVGPIVNGARKAALLAELATTLGAPPSQLVAVGDGANDLPMLAVAGRGIAYHAKPVVRRQAIHQITATELDSILYFLGLSADEIEVLTAPVNPQ